MTHGPPARILDKGAGSDALAQLVRETAPRYHIFGHQHNCFGTTVRGSVLRERVVDGRALRAVQAAARRRRRRGGRCADGAERVSFDVDCGVGGSRL